MRSIKIRAWDGKEFLPFASEVAFIHDSGNIRSRIDGVVFSQFTGLLDKHGREIYEGDLISLEHNSIPHIIVWSEYEYCMKCPVGGISQCGILNDICEVIGNIWENSDLLRDKTS